MSISLKDLHSLRSDVASKIWKYANNKNALSSFFRKKFTDSAPETADSVSLYSGQYEVGDPDPPFFLYHKKEDLSSSKYGVILENTQFGVSVRNVVTLNWDSNPSFLETKDDFRSELSELLTDKLLLVKPEDITGSFPLSKALMICFWLPISDLLDAASIECTEENVEKCFFDSQYPLLQDYILALWITERQQVTGAKTPMGTLLCKKDWKTISKSIWLHSSKEDLTLETDESKKLYQFSR